MQTIKIYRHDEIIIIFANFISAVHLFQRDKFGYHFYIHISADRVGCCFDDLITAKSEFDKLIKYITGKNNDSPHVIKCR